MDLEAIIRLQNFSYAVICKRVPHDDILSEYKKIGPPGCARSLHFAKIFTYRACSNL